MVVVIEIRVQVYRILGLLSHKQDIKYKARYKQILLNLLVSFFRTKVETTPLSSLLKQIKSKKICQ